MNSLKENAQAVNFNFTVDSLNAFCMEEAAEKLGYMEDPDET
jgi:hypothetical protein